MGTETKLEFDYPQLPLLIAFLLLAQGLDIATTALGLRLGIAEGNPVMVSLFQVQGELAMYGFKIFVATVVIVAIVALRRRYRRLWPIALAMVLPTLVAVLSNVVAIAEAHG